MRRGRTPERGPPRASSRLSRGPVPPPRPGSPARACHSSGGDPRELEDEPGDRRRHEGNERAGEERAKPEPGEVRLARGREPADPADLDSDGREIREAA